MNKKAIIIYPGNSPGDYGIDTDCDPMWNYHIYLSDDEIKDMEYTLRQHKDLMIKLEELHYKQNRPKCEAE